MKVVSALAVFAMCSAALAGCGGSDEVDAAITSATPAPAWETENEIAWDDAQEILDEAAEDFSDNYGIDLAAYVRVIGGPYEGLTAKVGGDERKYSASTIKAPLVMTVLNKYGDDLSQNVELSADNIVGGSGAISYAGTYPVGTLLRYVMAYSDNAAANALIDAVGGFDGVNETIEKAGVDPERYHLGNKMNIPNPSGDRSWISPSQSALFMTRIQEAADGSTEYDFTDQETARLALTYLTYGGAQKFAMYVGTAAQKTGDTDQGTNDHGILYTGAGPIAFGVTTTFDTPRNELADALLGQLGNRIASVLPDFDVVGPDGKPIPTDEAATWSTDSDGDGVPDAALAADRDGDGLPDVDPNASPDWYNPYRSEQY